MHNWTHKFTTDFFFAENAGRRCWALLVLMMGCLYNIKILANKCLKPGRTWGGFSDVMEVWSPSDKPPMLLLLIPISSLIFWNSSFKRNQPRHKDIPIQLQEAVLNTRFEGTGHICELVHAFCTPSVPNLPGFELRVTVTDSWVKTTSLGWRRAWLCPPQDIWQCLKTPWCVTRVRVGRSKGCC